MKRLTISITNSFAKDRRMIRTAIALKDQGYTITVMSRRQSSSSKAHISPEITEQPIKTWASKGFLFYMEYNLRLFIKLMISTTDVLLSVDSDTLLASTLVSKLRKIPLYIDMHELFTEVPELTDAPIKKAIWEWVEQWGINQSIRRYTVSNTIAEVYLDRYGKQFDVVRNVPPLTMNKSSVSKHDRFTLIYLGAVNMGRGLEELIRAMDNIPDTDLIILGTGDVYDYLQVLTAELNLGKVVRFLGWQEPNQIAHQLKKAHVGINLLDQQSLSYFLSLSNKYFDYIHAGLPSISMNFPEYAALNKTHTTSVLIDSLDEMEIRSAIIKLQQDVAYYHTLANVTNEAKEEWNWQKESLKLGPIYDNPG